MLARIEASQQQMRRPFADASHELRTPLASLRANAQLYQQGALQDPGEVDEVMGRIVLETRRMGRLVDDMLGLARLGQHPCQSREPVDLTAVVTGCAQRARLADPARTWQTRIAEGLTVTGDQELLRRAVDNLLTNVLVHTPAGTVGAISAQPLQPRGADRRGQARRQLSPVSDGPYGIDAHAREVGLPVSVAHRPSNSGAAVWNAADDRQPCIRRLGARLDEIGPRSRSVKAKCGISGCRPPILSVTGGLCSLVGGYRC
jgi:nitrogen-specific signal transduction histidine kinase